MQPSRATFLLARSLSRSLSLSLLFARRFRSFFPCARFSSRLRGSSVASASLCSMLLSVLWIVRRFNCSSSTFVLLDSPLFSFYSFMVFNFLVLCPLIPIYALSFFFTELLLFTTSLYPEDFLLFSFHINLSLRISFSISPFFKYTYF